MKNDVYFMYKVLDIEAVFLTDTDIWNFFYNLHIFLLKKDLFVVILYDPWFNFLAFLFLALNWLRFFHTKYLETKILGENNQLK